MKAKWDLIAVYKYIRRINTREGGEQFKPKDNVGTETNEFKQAMNKFQLHRKRKVSEHQKREALEQPERTSRNLTPSETAYWEGIGRVWGHMPAGSWT